MFLLLFHFAQDGFLLDFDEGAAVVFAEGEPEGFDVFALFLSGGVPYAVFLWGGRRRRRSSRRGVIGGIVGSVLLAAAFLLL